jgi:hypothetical protein
VATVYLVGNYSDVGLLFLDGARWMEAQASIGACADLPCLPFHEGEVDEGTVRDGGVEQHGMGSGAAPPHWRRPRRARALPAASRPCDGEDGWCCFFFLEP